MDQQLLFLINRQWTNPALDWLMAALSSFGAWALPIAVLLAVLLVKGNFRARACVLTAGAIIGINDGLITNPIKHAVDRARPAQALDGVRVVQLPPRRPGVLALFHPPSVVLSRAEFKPGDGRSFPSGHTMNCFSAATVGLCFYRRRAWWGVLLAALVGYSRIYSGSHWPSDVLTTVLLAGGASLLLLALADWLWQKIAGRWLPATHARHPRLFAP